MTRCSHRGSACAHVKYPMQAYKVGPERVSFWEVVGLVAFILFMYGTIIYALPIVLAGVAS